MDIIDNLRQLNLKYADQAAEIIESLREDKSFWHIRAYDLEERLLSIEQAHNDVLKDNERLRDALDQVLDDMGAEGRSVCEATKAQARYALGNNVDSEFDYYPLDRAISVLNEVGLISSVEEAWAALKETE